jgi:hypothetical protein
MSVTDAPAGLMFEQPPDAPTHANVLLYGPPKSGKSTAAATAPGPILWVNAEGPGALGYARKIAAERGTSLLEVRIGRGADARQVLRDVLKHVQADAEPHVETVVIDTVAKVREALIGQIVVAGAKNSLQQFGEVAKIIREFVRALRDLPVNMVLLAHQDVSDADGDRIVRPLVGGALTEELPGDVDVVAYTATFKDENTGARRYVGQLVEAKGRVAGDRSGALGEVRDLDLSEWLGVYRAALTPDTSDLAWDDPQDVPPTDPDGDPAELPLPIEVPS